MKESQDRDQRIKQEQKMQKSMKQAQEEQAEIKRMQNIEVEFFRKNPDLQQQVRDFMKYPKGKQQKEKDADKKMDSKKEAKESTTDIIDPEAFLKYLESVYSVENLTFLAKLTNLINLTSAGNVEQVQKAAKELKDLYVIPEADLLTNLGAEQKNNLTYALEQLAKNATAETIKQISVDLERPSKDSKEVKSAANKRVQAINKKWGEGKELAPEELSLQVLGAITKAKEEIVQLIIKDKMTLYKQSEFYKNAALHNGELNAVFSQIKKELGSESYRATNFGKNMDTTIKIPSFELFGIRTSDIQIWGYKTYNKVEKTLADLERIKHSTQDNVDNVTVTLDMLMLIKKEHPDLPINEQEFSTDFQDKLTRLNDINNAISAVNAELSKDTFDRLRELVAKVSDSKKVKKHVLDNLGLSVEQLGQANFEILKNIITRQSTHNLFDEPLFTEKEINVMIEDAMIADIIEEARKEDAVIMDAMLKERQSQNTRAEVKEQGMGPLAESPYSEVFNHTNEDGIETDEYTIKSPKKTNPIKSVKEFFKEGIWNGGKQLLGISKDNVDQAPPNSFAARAGRFAIYVPLFVPVVIPKSIAAGVGFLAEKVFGSEPKATEAQLKEAERAVAKMTEEMKVEKSRISAQSSEPVEHETIKKEEPAIEEPNKAGLDFLKDLTQGGNTKQVPRNPFDQAVANAHQSNKWSGEASAKAEALTKAVQGLAQGLAKKEDVNIPAPSTTPSITQGSAVQQVSINKAQEASSGR